MGLFQNPIEAGGTDVTRFGLGGIGWETKAGPATVSPPKIMKHVKTNRQALESNRCQARAGREATCADTKMPRQP